MGGVLMIALVIFHKVLTANAAPARFSSCANSGDNTGSRIVGAAPEINLVRGGDQRCCWACCQRGGGGSAVFFSLL